MTTKAITIRIPSVEPEIAITAFVMLVLVASASLLVSWLGLAG